MTLAFTFQPFFTSFFQTLQDSGYGDRSSKRFNPDKENYTPGKKVRKSLNSNWAPPLLRGVGEDR
jgi:hypothetical protein